MPAFPVSGAARGWRCLRWRMLAAALLAIQACEGADRAAFSRTVAQDSEPSAIRPAGLPGARYDRRTVDVWGEDGGRLAREQAARDPATILYGSGQLVRPTVASRTVEVTPEGDVIVAFADADVREVARAVLGDILGLNYAIAPAVQGTVTLQTSRPIPRDMVLGALEFALDANGAALVEAGGIFHIVPMAKAPMSARTARTFPGELPVGRGFGIHIVPLEHVSAEKMHELITPIAGKDTLLRADKIRNLIILGAPSKEAEGLIDTIAMLDVDWLSGMSFGYFPVHYMNARMLAEELEATLADQEATPIAGMLRFVPLERLNTILVISPQPRYLRFAGDWIRRLDQAGEDDVPQLFVYHVENGRASEIAEVLGRILGAEGAGGATTAGEVAPGFTPAGMRLSPDGGSGGDGPAGELVTTSLGDAGAAGLRSRDGTGRGGTAAISGASLTGAATGMRIVADEANNALVVYSTKRDFRLVRQALERLDLVPMQVLIEATIAEVTLNDELKYGIEWFFKSGKSSATFSSLETGVVGSAFPGFSYLLRGNSGRRRGIAPARWGAGPAE